MLSAFVTLAGCDGDDGSAGVQGPAGMDGRQSLITQTPVNQGDSQCFQGGTRIDSGLDANNNSVLDADEINDTSHICAPTVLNERQNFNRVSSFLVCSQIDTDCDTDTETAAEIIAASSDGMSLIYTDSPENQLGFVNIRDISQPLAAGTLNLSGEPTSVAVKGAYALVGVNTSTDFINVSGQLDVVDITNQTIVRSLDLGGQPDSVAVSPDGQFAAVVIENERDEDLDDGAPPQLPAGSFVIVDTADANPANWSTRMVDLTGVADLYAADPEPEYVDINQNNVAVVTLQENNHIILVNLVNGEIVNNFPAGSADLVAVDLTEGSPLFIDQSENQDNVLREPDGVAWINNEYFATADEGDLDGGSRGFTIFNTQGDVVWTAAESIDHLTARLGHYPDKRSGNKGNEPENVEVGIYGNDRYLFVNSERSSLVLVYDVADPSKPRYKQVLPAAAAPEGGLAIPARNLLVVASEEDNRGDKLRSAINIYRYDHTPASYPTLYSTDREDGSPIPWGAMSGLAADPLVNNTLYSIEDSFFKSTRIFTIQTAKDEHAAARITRETRISDSNDVFAAYPAANLVDASVNDDDASRVNVFDEADLQLMINEDKTVNIDAEGIAKAADGGFWIASEGSGTVNDSNRPINSLNFIFKTDANGVIENVISLPSGVNDMQLRFGFEGVAEYDNKLYVAFQRAWGSEANPRIGIYDLTNMTWSFVFYPLDAVESQNGGWVGLSDLTSIGSGEFLLIERDNQGGPDAAIKRLYSVDLSAAVANSTISKTLVRDLMADLRAPGGLIYEKVEGSAVTADGKVYIINDNDGVDDNSGETQLIDLGSLL